MLIKSQTRALNLVDYALPYRTITTCVFTFSGLRDVTVFVIKRYSCCYYQAILTFVVGVDLYKPVVYVKVITPGLVISSLGFVL